jgi:hypothetical protein
LARGEYIAFFDSDDVWLPHHLLDCFQMLDRFGGDWVFGACRAVDYSTGRVISDSTFYVNGRPRAFLGLHARPAGPGWLIDDPVLLRCMLSEGLFCGLQNSVIRADVFRDRRFHVHFRNEGEDVLMAIRVMAEGRRFAYAENVHVLYNIHDQNSSAVGATSVEKQIAVFSALLRGYDELRQQLKFSQGERRALYKSLSRICFWTVGYSLLWKSGRRVSALAMFHKGLSLWPWDPSYWRTYVLAVLRLPLRGWQSLHESSCRLN